MIDARASQPPFAFKFRPLNRPGMLFPQPASAAAATAGGNPCRWEPRITQERIGFRCRDGHRQSDGLRTRLLSGRHPCSKAAAGVNPGRSVLLYYYY